MRKLLLATPFVALIVLLTGCNLNQSSDEQDQVDEQTAPEEYVIDESDYIDNGELIEDIEKSEITKDEKAGLILMREEEKLARDVYTTLGEKWGTNIFSNIASSEQTHTDAVKSLLDRYGIEDPVKDDSVGAFTSPVMQKLYDDLVTKGEASLLDAFLVGATIEDLDIKDLNDLLKETDKEDIIVTYNNLNKGSRNHLRAYIEQVDRNGGSYTPRYISQEEYDEIISTDQEKGRAR